MNHIKKFNANNDGHDIIMDNLTKLNDVYTCKIHKERIHKGKKKNKFTYSIMIKDIDIDFFNFLGLYGLSTRSLISFKSNHEKYNKFISLLLEFFDRLLSESDISFNIYIGEDKITDWIDSITTLREEEVYKHIPNNFNGCVVICLNIEI